MSVHGLETGERFQAPSQPADAARARVARARGVALPGDDVVELHDDVSAEVALDLHHRLGSEATGRPIDVTAKLDSLLRDRSQLREREHLESPRIRQDRSVPTHEAMEPAESCDEVIARAQMEMV